MSQLLPAAEPLSAFVVRARELYTLPAVAVKVLELTAAPQVDARAIKNCIENDPSLTAKLLRVVNSALFGLSRQVSDLNQALGLLGVKPLKLLVLGFSLPKALFEGLEAQTLAAYWRRALTKAAGARDVSRLSWRRGDDEAFIAGLLQDIGQLALVQDLGEPYLAFLDRARREAGDLAERELAALGFDHAMFSARLLDHWGLPGSLVKAIAQRQEIERLAALPTAAGALPQALHLSELAARLLVDGQTEALEELHRAGLRYADLSPPQLDAWLRSLENAVAQLGEALDLELAAPIDSQRLLAAAKAQQAAVGAEATRDFEQAAAETRLWQEAETLRQAAAQFLSHRGPARPKVSAELAAGCPLRQTPQHGAKDQRSWPPSSSAAHPYDPALLARIEAAVSRCRQRRVGVSLLAAALDHEDRQAFLLGADGMRRATQLVAAAARAICETAAVHVDGACVTVALEDCDRPQAVALARRLTATIAQCTARPEWFSRAVTISVGAATLALPPRNFPPHELLDAAWRCLYGAQISGGNGVKSIDIY